MTRAWMPPTAARAAPAIGPRRVAAHLHFAAADGRTYLNRQRTPHPFHITRPFHHRDDPSKMARLYLQSSSGGLYGDDDLSLEIKAGHDSAAYVTTQASSIVHAGHGGTTRQGVSLHVADGAVLEYLPDPVILFSDAALEARLLVDVAAGGRAVVCDSVFAHAPGGDGAPFARFANRQEIAIAGAAPCFVEASDITGAQWARLGVACFATLHVIGAPDPDAAAAGLRGALQSVCDTRSDLYGAVAVRWPAGIVSARLTAGDGATLQAAMTALAAAAHVALTGHPPPPDRK